MHTPYTGPERRRGTMPVEWLGAQFDDLKTDVKDRHERLRNDMNNGFLMLGAKLDKHADDDQIVANRVLIIETQRQAEHAELGREKARTLRTANLRVGVFSLIVSSLVSFALWGLSILVR